MCVTVRAGAFVCQLKNVSILACSSLLNHRSTTQWERERERSVLSSLFSHFLPPLLGSRLLWLDLDALKYFRCMWWRGKKKQNETKNVDFITWKFLQKSRQKLTWSTFFFLPKFVEMGKLFLKLFWPRKQHLGKNMQLHFWSIKNGI